MRALVVALWLALGVAAPVARAEPVAPTAGSTLAPGARAPAPAAPRWGDGKTSPGSQPTEEPSKGPSYNYRQMALGAVIVALMGLFTIWLVRRSTRKA